MRGNLFSWKLTLALFWSFALVPIATWGDSTGPIANFGSGLCIQPVPPINDPGNFNVNGLIIVQVPCNGSLEQAWDFRFAGRYQESPRVVLDYFTIVNHRSGMCLDLTNGNTANGTHIQQWECGASTTMRWIPIPLGDTPHKSLESLRGLQKINRAKCLDIRGGSLQSGARLQIYDCTVYQNYAQEFVFNKP